MRRVSVDTDLRSFPGASCFLNFLYLFYCSMDDSQYHVSFKCPGVCFKYSILIGRLGLTCAHCWSCVCICDAQSCLTLYEPFDYNPRGSSVQEIFQARILEWVAMPSSWASSRPGDSTCVSHVSSTGRWVLYHCCHLGSPLRAQHRAFWLKTWPLSPRLWGLPAFLQMLRVSVVITLRWENLTPSRVLPLQSSPCDQLQSLWGLQHSTPSFLPSPHPPWRCLEPSPYFLHTISLSEWSSWPTRTDAGFAPRKKVPLKKVYVHKISLQLK